MRSYAGQKAKRKTGKGQVPHISFMARIRGLMSALEAQLPEGCMTTQRHYDPRMKPLVYTPWEDATTLLLTQTLLPPENMFSQKTKSRVLIQLVFLIICGICMGIP